MNTGEYNEQTRLLIPFFKKLSEDIKNNNLSIQQLKLAGEMYMMYKFNIETSDQIIDEDMIQKYLFTGWYVNNMITDSMSNPQV